MKHLDRLMNTVSDYKRSEDGNFAMMAALTSMMLLMGIGVAVDIAGLTKQNRGLQDSLDGAVIAAAASGEKEHVILKKTVQDTIDQNNTHGWKIKTMVTIENDEILATAETKYSPMIMGVFGKKNMNVKVNSAAPIAQETPVNIAMVLDTTNSMSGGNMDDLKASAVKLVEIVDDLDNDDSRISVVPFSNYVNVGMSRRNIAWMDVPPDGTTGPAPACYETSNYTSTGCTETTETRYNDGVPYTATIKTGCTETWTPTGEMYCPPAPSIEWRGCAGSRQAPENILAPAGVGTEIGGAMNATCGEEILPLTNDFDDVEDKIDSLSSYGNTYVPAGLIWGWRTLTPEAPFTEAATSAAKAIKAVVLMTDGANTMTQGNSYGSTDDRYHHSYNPSDTVKDNEARNRILGICDNIKADGILIYTVAYKLPGASKKTHDTLQSCASNASAAFDAKNRKQLKKAFEDIGNNLQVVRLSK